MDRAVHKLTETAIKNANFDKYGKRKKLADGGGLYLDIQKAGRYWRVKYRYGEKEKLLALGKYPEVSLKQARAGRDQAKRLLAAIWKEAVEGGDLKAVDRILKIMERRAKLLGLDAPTKVAATTASGEDSPTSGVFIVPSVAGSIDEWMHEVEAYQRESGAKGSIICDQ